MRTLSVSRATVRKVVRGHQTEFKYERGVQPVPKLGEWVEVLTELLEQEAKLPKRERRSTQRLFEELRGRGYDGCSATIRMRTRIASPEMLPDGEPVASSDLLPAECSSAGARMRRISMATRDELVVALRERYARAVGRSGAGSWMSSRR